VAPSAGNGLSKPSQIMLDKASTIARQKIGARIGRLDEQALMQA
jgi:mRNA interferase MazF